MLYAFVQLLANVCTDRPKTSAQRQVIPYSDYLNNSLGDSFACGPGQGTREVVGRLGLASFIYKPIYTIVYGLIWGKTLG